MWKMVKLGEICNVQRGTTITKKNTVEGAVPVIGGGTKPTYFHNEANRESGCITVSGSGASAGFVTYWDIPIFASDCSTIEIKNKQILQRFVYYFMQSQQQYIYENFRSGAAQPHVYAKDIATLDFPVIPLAEQQRIVEKLDAAFTEIDEAISVTQSQTSQAHNLFENIIAEQFSYKDGYERKTLQDICEKITDGTHQTPKYYEEGYIFLSSKNVTSRKIDWENVKYVDENQHVEMQKRLSPKVGDVLLAKNGTTGVAAMVDKDVIFNIYVSLAWLRSKGNVTPEYLLNFVNSKVARQQFSKRTKGIGVPNLHLREIREVEISFPNELSHQQKIVSKVSNIDEAYLKYCEILKDKLENLKTLKSAILSQAMQS